MFENSTGPGVLQHTMNSQGILTLGKLQDQNNTLQDEVLQKKLAYWLQKIHMETYKQQFTYFM